MKWDHGSLIECPGVWREEGSFEVQKGAGMGNHRVKIMPVTSRDFNEARHGFEVICIMKQLKDRIS